MMIEPTESESREELDLLIDALKQIAREAAENPELVKTAPHTTRVGRMDETASGAEAGAAVERAGGGGRGGCSGQGVVGERDRLNFNVAHRRNGFVRRVNSLYCRM